MSTAIVKGSIEQVAQAENTSLAMAFLDIEMVVLADVSGSMHAADARDNQRRYDVLCQELATLQTQNPGKLLVVGFSNLPKLALDGVPQFASGGTVLDKALRFAREYDLPDMRFVVISDGVPDNEQRALDEAAKYKGKISTVYVGPEGGSGQDFLARLAQANGGQSVKSDRCDLLAEKVERLLLTATA